MITQADRELTDKVIKLYKYNPLIQSKVRIAQLSAYDYAIWNFLFKALQNHIRQKLFVSFSSCEVVVNIDELKTFLYKDSAPLHWLREVRKSLKRMNDIQIELESFELPQIKDKLNDDIFFDKDTPIEKYDFLLLNLINDVAIVGKKELRCSFSKYFVFFAWYKKNYTHIDLRGYLLKSKYSQRIYEYIELVKSVNFSRNEDYTGFGIDKNTLEDIVGIEDSSVAVIFQKIRIDNVVQELRHFYPNLTITSPKRSNYIEFLHLV